MAPRPDAVGLHRLPRGLTDQRLPEGKVQVHRPGSPCPATSLYHRAGRERAPRPGGSQFGDAGAQLPAHRVAKEPGLVNGLGRPAVVKLLRPVGSDGQHWHARMVGLEHGWVELRRRGAARGDDRSGKSSCQPEAQGEKSRRTLVQQHVKPEIASLSRFGQRDQDGCRTRPGAGNRVGDASAQPFVH